MSDPAKDAFADALELDDHARRAFLAERLADDPDALRRAINLLDAHEKAGRFMASPTLTPTGPSPDGADQMLGATIGPYTIESVLGEGGFGIVYLASQAHPVQRSVAVKVIKPGMGTAQLVARIDAERQFLARMDHPNISKILDAGATPDRRPYFVMEYVAGPPITDFCAAHSLTLRDRLELMRKVCLAVQHAHHKGVIHRDIKPSNVLVTEIDGAPEPRVIDFGIAKIVEGPDSADFTRLTLTGHIFGTPAYMSPEQISAPSDLDSRADTYSLGALLYELVVGQTPIEEHRLREGSIATIARIICEEQPARPSTRILRIDRAHRPPSEFRRELDWIILKAMEKAPERRYQSASAFAADIERYLANEPLEAAPPSGIYRLNKFARKHAGAVIGSALAAAAICALAVASVVFAINTLAQKRETAVQLERAKEVVAFAQELFTGVNPAVARGEDRTLLRRMLEDAVARIDENPPASNQVAHEVRGLLARGLFAITEYDQSYRQYLLAAAAAAEEFGQDHPETLATRGKAGESLNQLSRFSESLEVFKEVHADYQRIYGDNHEDTISADFSIGMVQRQLGDSQSAVETFRRVLDRAPAVIGDPTPLTMSMRNSLATTLIELRQFDECIELFEQVVDYQRRELGEDHPNLLATRNNLTQALSELGRLDEAIAIQEDVLETKRRILEPNHPSMIVSLNNIASLYNSAGRTDEALTIYENAADVSMETFGPDDRRTLFLTFNLASLYIDLDRAEEGLPLLEAALPRCHDTLSDRHPLATAMSRDLSRGHRMIGNHDRAIAISQDLIAHTDAFMSPDDPARPLIRLGLGKAFVAAGRADEAHDILLHTHAALAARDGQDSDRARETAQAIADMYEQLGRPDDAAQWRTRAE